MADQFLFYILCPVCDGDGVKTAPSPIPPYPIEDIECPECLGPNAKFPKAGYLFRGWLEQYDVD